MNPTEPAAITGKIPLQAGRWLRAELAPWIGQATDRAGNGYAYLSVTVLSGTELDSEWVRDSEGSARPSLGTKVTLLDQDVTIYVKVSPVMLGGLARKALRSKGGRAKAGALTALRGVKVLKTKTEVRP